MRLVVLYLYLLFLFFILHKCTLQQLRSLSEVVCCSVCRWIQHYGKQSTENSALEAVHRKHYLINDINLIFLTYLFNDVLSFLPFDL